MTDKLKSSNYSLLEYVYWLECDEKITIRFVGTNT
jgi:hypothetical protein